MKAQTVIPWLLLAAGAYAVYRLVGALNREKDKLTESLASVWLKLFPMPPAIELLGAVIFPGNLRVPLQQLANERAIKQDRDHNVFVNYADHLWKLSPSNASGNWPATLVQ